ncbi:MAG TPA: type II toxin-antitoxin system VapC family toxin [Acidimicrobiales bacterium]|nr:type II toxin-antitoxin system VapC family toxin [Acidimicrobiales bacterium]
MVVVADSHALVWYLSGSRRLSRAARSALEDAEASKGLVVSVASMIDLWYVSQSTGRVSTADLGELRRRLASSDAVRLEPVSLAIADASMTIPRTVLADPWDRLILATAIALGVSLVTADGPIRKSGLVDTIW